MKEISSVILAIFSKFFCFESPINWNLIAIGNDFLLKTLKKYKTKEVLDIVEYNFNLFKDIEHKKQIVEKFFLKPFEKLVMKKFSLI